MQIKMRESRKGEDGTTVLLKGSTYPVSQSFGAALVQQGLAEDVTGSTALPQQVDLAYDRARNVMLSDGGRLPVRLTDESDRGITRSGRQLRGNGYTDVEGLLIFFDLQEGTSNKVYDQSGQLVGSINGGSTGTRWGQNGPGFSPNGSNSRISVTDGAQAGFTAAARMAHDLSTLVARQDQITVFGVVSHPPTIPSDCWLWSWGMNADPANKGGWAVGLKATSGKLRFAVRPKGAGSSTVATDIGVTGARGQNADNTRTAWAIEISAAGTTGLLEVRGYMLTLGTDGGNAQSNVGLDTPALVPNGTGAPSADASLPIMLCAWPDTNSSTFVGIVGPGMAVCSQGIKRGAYDPGVGMRICRDLRNNPLVLPDSAR